MTSINKQIKRIGIDARFYGPVGKGLGRYTKEVVDRVIKLDRENEYVIFLGRDNYDEFSDDMPRVKKVLTDIRWYTIAEQLKFPQIIKKEKIDLMHFPHFNVPLFTPVPFIVTVHDLILTKFPTQRASTLSPLVYKIKNAAYKLVIKKAIKRAKKVIAVSEFTKDDILKQFKVSPSKVIVTYEGVADSFKKKLLDNKIILSKYNIGGPFLLYVGNAYPHKNLESLIDVFALINKKRPELSLVLVGKEDYFYKRVMKYAKKKNEAKIIFPGYVLDEDLASFYGEAIVYVFPSNYEGFGLPPLEAMTNGCPVVSSNKSCLTEVLGDAALYFDPKNKVNMEEIINKIIDNKNLREKLMQKGYEQIKKYSWDKCAKSTVKIYKEILT